ncbi:MAG: lmo0937 family membrane protein [Acidobacteriota bacterium]|nr:lmo0937 family membrane protein [Acidobacteriota bacterium]
MLWTVCVVLLALWLIGLVSSFTFGGLLHILLVAAIVAGLIQIVSGKRVM